MRVLIIHQSPQADSPAVEFEAAAREFNRTLDIRLRFLDVGFELRRLGVASDDDQAPADLLALQARFSPTVLLVLGRGPRLLECVAASAKARARIAVLLNGEADRTTHAIARMSHVLVTMADGSFRPTIPGAETHLLDPARPMASALVDVLVRSGRRGGIQ